MEALPVNVALQRIPELEAVATIRPTSLVLHDLAVAYFTVGQPERALFLAQAAWHKNRQWSIALSMGLILKDLGRHEESLEMIEAAYHLQPEDDYVKLGYGEGLLKAGLWSQAWPIYDRARPTQELAAIDLRLPHTIREWDGKPLGAKDQLLVINEGGTGDRLSYARWLPQLTAMGIDWKFYPYAELFSVFERIFPREKLVADGDDVNPTHWTTTFALPAKLGATPTIVPPPLKVTATEDAIKKFHVEQSDTLPIVGICYEAAEQHQGGLRVRSMSEGQAMRLVCMTGNIIHWVNLQYGKRMPHPVVNPDFKTWEDTAGLIHNLDAVVTVDTSVMHLAGAMGKPMSVLLSGNSCWKFLKKGPKCVWYPTAKLYRNNGRGFEDAVDQLIADIRSSKKIVPAPCHI